MILLILIVLLLLPVAYLFLCDIYYKGRLNKEKIIYLKNNSVKIDIKSPNLPTNFLASPKKDFFNVYILGEFHGFSFTHLFDASFFIYLNKNFGVRDYYSEFFTQDADSLNLFLSKNSLDLDILYHVINNIAKNNIPQWNTREYYKKWISLYHYNKTLPDSAKLKVHGLLGDQKNFDGKRDSIMASILINLRNDNQLSQNIYCLTGMFHAMQERFTNTPEPFALRLKEEGFNPLSIIQHSSNSMMFVPKGIYPITPPCEKAKFFNSDGWIYYFSHIKDLKIASEKKSVTLYKLNGENSPYYNCHDFVDSHGPYSFMNFYLTPIETNVTTDYFQYVLFINSAESPQKLIPNIQY